MGHIPPEFPQDLIEILLLQATPTSTQLRDLHNSLFAWMQDIVKDIIQRKHLHPFLQDGKEVDAIVLAMKRVLGADFNGFSKSYVNVIRKYRPDKGNILVVLSGFLRLSISCSINDVLRKEDPAYHAMKLRFRNAASKYPVIERVKAVGSYLYFHVEYGHIQLDTITRRDIWTIEELENLAQPYIKNINGKNIVTYMISVLEEIGSYDAKMPYLGEKEFIRATINLLGYFKKKEYELTEFDGAYAPFEEDDVTKIRQVVGDGLLASVERQIDKLSANSWRLSQQEAFVIKAAVSKYQAHLLYGEKSSLYKLFSEKYGHQGLGVIEKEIYDDRYANKLQYCVRLLKRELVRIARESQSVGNDTNL